jgi:RNA polymerase sigma factor (sigma-70 family)
MARQRPAQCKDGYPLPAVYMRSLPRGVDPRAESLWELWDADRSIPNRNALAEHYLPLVFMVARNMANHIDIYARAPLGELISDGTLGLLDAIKRCRPHTFQAMRTRGYLGACIRFRIRAERAERSWVNRVEGERQTVVERVRENLTQRLGRLPTPEQMTAAIAGLVTNPSLRLGEAVKMVFTSEDREARRSINESPDPSDFCPEEGLLQQELMKMACRKLGREDRALLRMILKGKSQADVARAMGITSKQANWRMNGLLWTLRCRVELADYLGVQPAPWVARYPNGQVRCIAGLRPSPLKREAM